MGWYGGQNGAQRLRARTSVQDSFARFRASLNINSDKSLVDFTTLEDNSAFDLSLS